MFKIQCPFFCLFGDKIKCPYLDNHMNICFDIEIAPGNEDAWCSGKIEEALNPPKHVCDACGKLMIDSPFTKNPNEDTFMRQNYSCNICGLKSFVVYNSKENIFDVAIKIREDHKEKEPTCPCPIDDLNMVEDPIKIWLRIQ
jgi:hypothetical protein